MLEFEVKNSEISSHLPSKKIQSQKKITITRKKNNEKSSKGNQKCQNIFNPLKSNWLEKYKPKSITDLKVHHTKLKALRDWLEKAQDYDPQRDLPPLLVLYGVSGNGKSVLLDLVSSEKNFEIVSWTEDLWETEILKFSSNGSYNSKTSQWHDFSSRSKYPSLSISQNEKNKFSKKLLVIQDPIVSISKDSNSYSNTNTLFETMYSNLILAQIPCVLIISDALEKDDESTIYYKYLPRVIRDKMKIEFLFLPPATELKISKLLEDITNKEGLQNIFTKNQRDKIIEIISSNSLGDIRHSIITYQMACAIELGKQKLQTHQPNNIERSSSVISLIEDDEEEKEILIQPIKRKKTVIIDDEFESENNKPTKINEDFEIPISIRDNLYSNLHVVLKFLHSKLDQDGKLNINPDLIISESQISPESFLQSLFSHSSSSLEYYINAAWDQGDNDMEVQVLESIEKASDYFSFCENLIHTKYNPLLHIDRHSGSSTFPEEECMSILSRVLPVCKGIGLEEKINYKKSLGIKLDFKGFMKSSKIFQLNFQLRNNSLKNSLKLSNYHKNLLEIKDNKEIFCDYDIDDENGVSNLNLNSQNKNYTNYNNYYNSNNNYIKTYNHFNNNQIHSDSNSLTFNSYTSRTFALDIASMSYYLPQINYLSGGANNFEKPIVSPLVTEEEAQIILELPDDEIEEYD